MEYVFAPGKLPVVPLYGSAQGYPVHRIYCVGRNYSDHVKEMGGDPKSEPPVFFSKPADAIVIENNPVAYPLATNDVHHEVELVVALGQGGKNIGRDAALGCVFGYAVGVDLTRRDLQAMAKKQGRPWDVAKGFDQSAPISPINPLSNLISHPHQGSITMKVNGELRQNANLNEMIWSVTEIICELSKYYELRAGDLIFTGTPAGVSAIKAGDILRAEIERVGSLEFRII